MIYLIINILLIILSIYCIYKSNYYLKLSEKELEKANELLARARANSSPAKERIVEQVQ